VDPAENLRVYKEKPAPILLKVPVGEKVAFEDHVRGRVEVSTDTIRDPALLRKAGPDGTCGALYSFATVVDEIDFGITHVIRAEEHLSNTPAQILIFKALGGTVPEFAHVPLIYRDAKKISKRDLPPLSDEEVAKLKACGWTEAELKGRDDLNLATVAYYRELGYLPQAVLNYLVRLGWSLDESSEKIPLDVVVKNFSLDRVTKAPGNFDMKKLFWLQSEYMKELPTAEKVEKCLPYLRRAGYVGETLDASTRELFTRIVEASGDRIKLLSDAVFYAAPILKENPEYNPKAVADKLSKPGVADRLRGFVAELRTLEPFDAPTILAAFSAFAAKVGVKPRDLDGSVRVAVTGETVGFGLPETLVLLGREKAIKRIEKGAEMAG
jgi:glutamyl-tRNA synthetase